MKKHSKLFTLPVAILCSFLVASCSDGNPSSSGDPSTDPTTEPTPVPPESDIEIAMKNFYEKIQGGNYTLSDPNLTVSVASRDVLALNYDPSIAGAKDEGVMSVNNETFKVNLEAPGQIFNYIQFVDKGPAIDVAGSILPNYWFASGNVWEYWQHDDSKPAYEFYSTHQDVKIALGQLYVLGELEALTVSQMHLKFDSVDVNSAQITAKYIEGAGTSEMTPKDMVIDFTFGNATCDQRLTEWVNDPNRKYPADVGKTGWGTLIDTLVVSELLSNDYARYFPLMTSASYAVICNSDTFLSDGYVKVHDYHGTPEDAENYAKTLENNKFYKVTLDGQDWYRKLLRTKSDDKEFQLFSDISVFFDHDGVTILLNGYYNRQIIHDFDTLNSLITAKSFPELSASDAYTSVDMFNSPFEGQEAQQYFNNKDLEVHVTYTFNDKDAFDAYFGAYCDALEEDGFTQYPDDSYTVYKKNDTANGQKFVAQKLDDNTYRFFITNEVYVDPTLAINEINSVGFPEMTADGIDYIIDRTINQHLSHGEDWNPYLFLYYEFDTAEEANTRGETYLQALIDSPDFVKDPQETGRKGIYNSTDGKLKVRLDYNEGQTGLYFWFGINH